MIQWHCRQVTTLYDLQEQLCLDLKVSDFSQLELGPLLRNPVIIQSFKPPADRVEVLKVGAVLGRVAQLWVMFTT